MRTPPLSPLLLTPEPEAVSGPQASELETIKAPSVFGRLCIGIGVLTVAAAFFPLLSQHVLTLWRSSEYQHAPILLGAIALLFWLRWPDKSEFRQSSIPRSWGLIAGLLGLFAAVLLNSPPLAMLAALPAVWSSMCGASRTVDTRRFLGPCLLLLLLVPMPYFLQMELVQTLKSWTTQAASWILDLLAIDHQLLGFTIAVPGKWFFVDDACSGVNSLFGMVALALVLAVWSRLSWVVTLSTIPAALLGVLCVNILRMVIIVAAYSWRGIDLASGAPHQWLGLALLPLTLLMVVGLVGWTQWLLAPIGAFGDSPLTDLWDRVLHGGHLPDDDHDLEPSTTEPMLVQFSGDHSSGGSGSVWSWLFAACLAGIAIYGQSHLRAANAASARSHHSMASTDQQSLPETFMNWKQVDFRDLERRQQDPQGQHSRIWRYRNTETDRSLLVSVDYPFPGWHELTACYRATGWTVQDRKVSGGQGKPFMVRVTMKDGTGTTGWLWYSLVDAQGKTLEPPQKHWSATLLNQLRIALNQFGADTTTRQIQMVVPGGRELSPDELLQLDQKFREWIPRLAPKLAGEKTQKLPRSEQAL